MKDCKARVKKIIDEMHPDDIEALLPVIEQIAGLRETIEILEEDPDITEAIKEADREIAAGKVRVIERK